ncbi:PREDICTED: uncharacterized protein LOC105555889 [Vollenhovia emeryi]|uniref:uncharacterized protein LOC105555889 n=1 Tax=Vollenhovia emeryi TaxID=411798 RepID=UPI0005F4114D|nr:PREDICTED: uncharacterized protein LOC105555889 [Vollenhovia emeryi]
MLFGGTKSEPQLHKGHRVNVKSLDDSYDCNFVALSQKVICQNIPSINKGPWIKELQSEGIQLTDVDSRDEPVSILLGADIAGKLMTTDRKELKCGAIALKTLLGWTLMGKTNVQSSRKKEDTALMMVSMFVQEASITDLWKLDTLGIEDPIMKITAEEHQAQVQETFRQTIRMNGEDRYEVQLPWKKDHLPLTDNRVTAERRLDSITKKLKMQGFYEAYQEIFRQWLAEGIIEKVPVEEEEKESYYLPHSV